MLWLLAFKYRGNQKWDRPSVFRQTHQSGQYAASWNEGQGYRNVFPRLPDWNHIPFSANGWNEAVSRASANASTHTWISDKHCGFNRCAGTHTHTHMLNIIRQEPEDFLHPTNVLPVCQMAPVCAENRPPLPRRRQNIKRCNGHQSKTWSPLDSLLPLSCHLHFIFWRWTKAVGCFFFWRSVEISSQITSNTLVPSSEAIVLKPMEEHLILLRLLNSLAAVALQTTNTTVAATPLMCLHLKAEAFEIDIGRA